MKQEINNMSRKAIEVKNAMEEALQSCRTIGGKILRGEKVTIKSRSGYKVEKTVWLDGDVVKVLVKCESEGVEGLYTSSPKPIEYDLRHFRDFMSGNISEYDDSTMGCIGGNLKAFVKNILNNLSLEILEIIHRADLITITEHRTDKEAVVFDDLNNYYIEKLEIIHEIEDIEKIVDHIHFHTLNNEDRYGVSIDFSVVISEETYYGEEELSELFQPYIVDDKVSDELIKIINENTPYEFVDYEPGGLDCLYVIRLQLKEKNIEENAKEMADNIISECEYDDKDVMRFSFEDSFMEYQKDVYDGYLGYINDALDEKGWEFDYKYEVNNGEIVYQYNRKLRTIVDVERYVKEDVNSHTDEEYGVTINTYIYIDGDVRLDKLLDEIDIYTKYKVCGIDDECNEIIRLRLKDEYIKQKAEEFAEEIIDYDLAWGHKEVVDEDEVDELTWSFNKEDYGEYEEYVIKALANKGWEFTDKHYFNKWHYHFKKVA